MSRLNKHRFGDGVNPYIHNREIGLLWADTLESDRFVQGKRKLKNAAGEVCVLGVLCELAVEHGVIPPSALDSSTGCHYYVDTCANLPDEVRIWVGLNYRAPYLPKDNKFLSTLNDHGVSFRDIAHLIREQLIR